MNPIAMDGKRPPGLTTFEAMFSLLCKQAKNPRRVNTIGNLMPIAEENELLDFLRFHGFDEVSHIEQCTSYEDFLAMSESCLNLLLAPGAAAAAKDLEKRLDTPYFSAFVSYDLDEIEKTYEELERSFADGRSFEFLHYRKEAEDQIAQTLDVLKDTPVAVGCGATVRPCSLALALIKYGFHVTTLIVDKVIPPDRPAFEALKSSDVTIERISPQDHEYILEKHIMPNCVAIGFEASYITKTRHIAALCDDEGMFGYAGVGEIMKMLRDAKCGESDLKPLLDAYGAIV